MRLMRLMCLTGLMGLMGFIVAPIRVRNLPKKIHNQTFSFLVIAIRPLLGFSVVGRFVLPDLGFWEIPFGECLICKNRRFLGQIWVDFGTFSGPGFKRTMEFPGTKQKNQAATFFLEEFTWTDGFSFCFRKPPGGRSRSRRGGERMGQAPARISATRRGTGRLPASSQHSAGFDRSKWGPLCAPSVLSIADISLRTLPRKATVSRFWCFCTCPHQPNINSAEHNENVEMKKKRRCGGRRLSMSM